MFEPARRDFALIPVNTAQAYLGEGTFHSALSISVTQDLSEQVSVSAGKFNMMTLASRTPLIGGGGIDTFMNRALALPSTGVAYTAARGGAADRVVISAPYLIGGLVTIKTAPVIVTFGVLDPRSAENPKVIEHPFEKGVAAGVSATVPTEIFGLSGFHTLRAAYSDARGVDLDEIGPIRPLAGASVVTKKGYWFGSYAIQQNLFQSETNPAVGWGLFGLAARSDGNPTPVKWNMLVGLAGNNLLDGRENDRWGVGFFHYGVTEPLLAGLNALGFARRGEGGVEGFYNFAMGRGYASPPICKSSTRGIPASSGRQSRRCVCRRSFSRRSSRRDRHSPANLLTSLWTNSAIGYLNRNSGAIGSKAAVMTVTDRRVLTGTVRMPRTTATLLDKSANDCKSGVPNKGSAGAPDAFSHFFSKSFT